MLDDSVVCEPMWEPRYVDWQHPKIEKFIREKYKEMEDREIAKEIEKQVGVGVSISQVKRKRLNMGLKKSSKPSSPGGGKQREVDVDNVDMVKFIQTRYKKHNDYELVKLFNERFGTEANWKQMEDARRELGYKRGRNSGWASNIEYDSEMRDFIYWNHPEFRGEGTKVDFVAEFKEEFDLPQKPKALLRSIRKFVRRDQSLNSRKDIVWESLPQHKIKLFFPS